MTQRKDVTDLYSGCNEQADVAVIKRKHQASSPAVQAFLGRYLDDVGVGSALVRLVVLRVLEEHFVHVGAGVLEQLVGAVEDDECYFTVTEHAEFIGFLH